MKPTGEDVATFIDKVTPAARKRDAAAMLQLLTEVTGHQPVMWGTVVGFGSCHYRYPTGTEGDSPILGFAPRKQATTVYLLDGIGAHADRLPALGPHTTGVGCLYVKDVAAVDAEVLRGILKDSYERVVEGRVETVTATDMA
jgi:hypothetical protein